jgi:hypothetical protein
MRFDISPRVVHLFNVSCPFYIAGIVALGIIYALNAHTVRSFTNVPKKVFKIKPLLVDRNAPASVILKIWTLGVGASLNHARPSVVCGGKRSRVSVGQMALASRLFPKAAAGRTSASHQRTVEHGQHLTAVAAAKAFPGRSAVGVNMSGGITDDFKPSKPSTDERYFCGHNDVLGIVLFSGGRPATTGARCDYPHKTAMEAQV